MGGRNASCSSCEGVLKAKQMDDDNTKYSGRGAKRRKKKANGTRNYKRTRWMCIFDSLDKRKEKQEKRSYAKERTSITLWPLLVAVCFFFVLGFLFCSLSGHLERQKVTKKANEGAMEREQERQREQTPRYSLMGLVSLQICAKGVLARVGDVEEAILVLMFLVDGRHQGRCGGENLVDKDEDGLLGGELDALADHVDKLADSQVREIGRAHV